MVYQLIEIALNNLKENKESKLIIPIYLRAQDIKNISRADNLDNVIFEVLKKYSEFCTLQDVKNWIKNSKFVIVIDELEKNKNIDSINLLYEKLIKNNPNGSLVLLSRIMEELSCPFSFVPTVWYLKFVNIAKSVTAVQNLISKNERATSRFKELVQNGIMERIPRTPLALKVLSHVFGADLKSTPNNGFEFFDMFFEIVLGRWEPNRNTENLFDYAQVRTFFERSAFLMIQKGVTNIKARELEFIAKEILDGIGERKITPKDFIVTVATSGDIGFIEGDQFEFSSRTFLEFLAGCELKNQNWEKDFILEYLTDPDWEDAIIFGAGGKRRDDSDLPPIFDPNLS